MGETMFALTSHTDLLAATAPRTTGNAGRDGCNA